MAWKENGPENHAWYCRLCTDFRKVFEGRHLLGEAKLMNAKWITYVFAMKLLMIDSKCAARWDNRSYFSFTQTEEKQKDLNFMAKKQYFSSLELSSHISSIQLLGFVLKVGTELGKAVLLWFPPVCSLTLLRRTWLLIGVVRKTGGLLIFGE